MKRVKKKDLERPRRYKYKRVSFSKRDYNLLREAVSMAHEWRGIYIGEDRNKFDERSKARWYMLFRIRRVLFKKRKPS
jgi:hypothetical protein